MNEKVFLKQFARYEFLLDAVAEALTEMKTEPGIHLYRWLPLTGKLSKADPVIGYKKRKCNY